MALRNIRTDNDPILRKKSKPVKEINASVITLLDDMRETMNSVEGIGIAAVQVGVLKRVFIVSIEENDFECINPEIIEMSGTQTRNEGCLSVPGYNGRVERPAYVKLKCLDRNGNEQIVEGTELTAVALCHEYDHLDGILYTDKAEEVFEVTRDEEADAETSEGSEAQ